MRLPRFVLLVTLALAAMAGPASAQNQYTIQGVVRDAATGKSPETTPRVAIRRQPDWCRRRNPISSIPE